MYKWVLFEVVKWNREEQDKAYRAKAAKILKRHGVQENTWRVSGRTVGQVMVEFGPFESEQEALETFAKVSADKEWKALQDERSNLETIVPGSMEQYIVTAY